MKKIITAAFCIAFAFNAAISVYAAEDLDREYIETEIWEEMWQGKGDNGLDFPEASYKHHLLDEWLDENYGSGEYDWTDIGELKFAYKEYYRDYIKDFDFEDDNNGNWTIDTEDEHYSFTLLNGIWQMMDKNGNTVDTFPPLSTLEEKSGSEGGYEIKDDGEDSPKVVGKVTEGTETASGGVSSVDSEVTPDTASSVSESRSGVSESSPLPIIAGAILAASIGVGGFFVLKKKK